MKKKSTSQANNSPEPLKQGDVLITIKDLVRNYGKGSGETKVLKGINLTIKKGEFLIIVGSSGSGKTTLLNSIGGIDNPTSGSIIVDGVDITKLNDHDLTIYRRDKVGFIFQTFNLLPNLTAQENVALSASLAHSPKEDVDKALNAMGLEQCKYKYPSQMSGGQQQRISIARALVKHSDFYYVMNPLARLTMSLANKY